MATISAWSFLFLILSSLHVVTSQSRVVPLFYTIGNVTSFNGSSLTSLDCGLPCFKLIDNITGPIDSIYDDLGSFFAFSRQSGAGVILFLLPVAVSRVVLYFFNSPKDSIGLPQISINDLIVGGGSASISFTYDDNDELDQSDSRLRNVSLNLNESSIAFTINIMFINSIQIDWFLLSEVEFYNGSLVLPSLNPLVFQDSPSQVSLGPDNPQSSVSISCTLVNSGSFEWMWEYEGSDVPVDRSEVWIANATRTSILVINELRYIDSGNYTCSAKHTTDNTYYNISTRLNLNVAITAAVNNVSVHVSDSFVTLSCETFGYLVNGIEWMRNGVELSVGKYSVSTLAGDISSISNNGSSTNSIISQLNISNITEQDDGVYICVIQDTTIQETITLHILSTVNSPSISVSTDPFTSEVLVLSSSSSFYSSTLLTTVTNTEVITPANTPPLISPSITPSNTPLLTSLSIIPSTTPLLASLISKNRASSDIPVNVFTVTIRSNTPSLLTPASKRDNEAIIITISVIGVLVLIITSVMILIINGCYLWRHSKKSNTTMNMTQNEVYNITDFKVSDNAAYSICKQQNDVVYEEIDNM